MTMELRGPEIPKGVVPPCVGRTALFFAPDRNRGNQPQSETDRVAACKAVCAMCPAEVFVSCLEWGKREKFGVWGGVDRDAVAAQPRRAARARLRERLAVQRAAVAS